MMVYDGKKEHCYTPRSLLGAGKVFKGSYWKGLAALRCLPFPFTYLTII